MVCSDLNPYANHLAYTNVMTSDDGLKSLEILKKQSFPISVYVARGPGGSACTDEGVEEMLKILGKKRLSVKIFDKAGHSIHNTDREGFCNLVHKQWMESNL